MGMVGQPIPPQSNITNCTFANNYAEGSGGALYLAMAFGSVVITDSTFSSNEAQALGISGTGMGGAVYLTQAYEDQTFWPHSDAIGLTGHAAELSDSTSWDSATRRSLMQSQGKMSFADHAKISFVDCLFTDNVVVPQALTEYSLDAGLRGGAIAVGGAGTSAAIHILIQKCAPCEFLASAALTRLHFSSPAAPSCATARARVAQSGTTACPSSCTSSSPVWATLCLVEAITPSAPLLSPLLKSLHSSTFTVACAIFKVQAGTTATIT